jgi:hypothetical protein
MYVIHTIWSIWHINRDEQRRTDVGGQKGLDRLTLIDVGWKFMDVRQNCDERQTKVDRRRTKLRRTSNETMMEQNGTNCVDNDNERQLCRPHRQRATASTMPMAGNCANNINRGQQCWRRRQRATTSTPSMDDNCAYNDVVEWSASTSFKRWCAEKKREIFFSSTSCFFFYYSLLFLLLPKLL